MKRITGRFVLFIATAAILPLVLYGAVSVEQLRSGTEQSVSEGNQAIARQLAEQVSQYLDNNVRVLVSIGTEIQGTQLEPWQQTRVLTNHVLDFPEFREISLFDATGRPIESSSVGPSTLSIPESAEAQARSRRFYLSPVQLDADALPAATIAVPLFEGSAGARWMVAEMSLEQLWRTIDRMRVGTNGYALLLDRQNTFLAHGNPNDKALVATGESASADEQALANAVRADPEYAGFRRLSDPRGEEVLAVAAAVESANWTVIVEQPTKDAFSVAHSIERLLLGAIGLALLATLALGWLWGRSFIRRIYALTKVTRAIADGRMDERVALSGQDEIRQLGDAFNSMADRLVELQEDVRKQERQAMFGRIAAGLVHDLSHPIQNIGNSCKLIQKMFEDAEYRETFKKTVERELVIVKRVLDDLRNIARPIPLERFALDVNRTVAEAVEAMQPHAETAGLTLQAELSPEPAYIEGDVFALGRVYRNLILNAIQATAPAA